MSRCSSNDHAGGAASLYYYPRERNGPLRIRAFYIRLALCPVGPPQHAPPESLTLVYLPRINGAPLEVNGARVRPDAPAFVALHRVRSAESGGGERVYGCTDRVRAGEGVRFEAYVGEERALKGSFRRREGGGWRMECRCAAEMGAAVGAAAAAEVCVAGEGKLVMREMVEMTPAAAAAARRRHRRFCSRLEEIPEELGEGEGCCDGEEDDDDGWEMIGFHSEEEEEEDGDVWERCWEVEEEEMGGLEGVRWAVDLGIWAVCLGVGVGVGVGVGFLVSKASSQRRRLF